METDPPFIRSVWGDSWDLSRITITFSEPVVGALVPDFYYLEEDFGSGEVSGVTNVSYGVSNDVVVLTLAGTRNPDGRYTLHIVHHAIEDLYGNPLPDPAFAFVTVPTVFQNGRSGYTGTQDADLRQSSPTANSGANTNVLSDASPLTHGLLRFDHIFDGFDGILRYQSIIDRAHLRLYTLDRSAANTPVRMLRMVAPWEQGQSTWNSMGNGIDETNGVETGTTDGLIVADVANAFVEIDVTAAVQAWTDGAPNYGWAFLPTGPDGWGWASSEYPDPARRPALVVEHTHGDPGCMIIEQPAPVTVRAGAPFTLSILSIGSDLTYQWFRNGTAIPGVTASTYSVNRARLSDNGAYHVVVRGGLDPDSPCTSAVAQVTVFCDDFPVRLLSAIGNPDQTTITLQFSHGLETSLVTNVSNYNIDGLMITGVSHSGNRVILTNSPERQFGRNYTLAIMNLRENTDCANTLSPNPTVLTLTQDVRLLSFNAFWSYENSGLDLGTAWRLPMFDDRSWRYGQALLGLETNESTLQALAAQNLWIRTDLRRTNEVTGFTNITDYFRTIVTVPFSTQGVTFTIRHVTDDGAVFYFNGTEAARFNMPTGEVNASTLAITGPAEGVIRSITNLTGLSCGRNSLAVEVHQTGIATPDVLFGAELIARVPEFLFVEPCKDIRIVLNEDRTATLTWTPAVATILEADQVTGPWRRLRDVVSPWRIPVTNASRFYGLRVP